MREMNDKGTLDEMFASTFLGMFAEEINRRIDIAMSEPLRNVFGNSSIAEYAVHRSILVSKSPYWCVQLEPNVMHSGSAIQIPLNDLVLKHIRSIQELAQLHVGEYGLPTRTNFEFGDAFVRLSNGKLIVIRAGLSHKHKADQNKRYEIATAAGIEVNQLVLLFILPSDQLPHFSYQNSINDMLQYMSTSAPQVSKNAILKLSQAKKRAISEV